MLKPNIELIKDGHPKVKLAWHKHDAEGHVVPIHIEYADDVDAETRERIQAVCDRPMRTFEDGKAVTAYTGSSKHFMELPRALGRLGFRTRIY
jgi:hypothetical protein